MSLIKCNLSISLDGFVAGPNQSQENPIGVGQPRLEIIKVVASSGVTHIKYALSR